MSADRVSLALLVGALALIALALADPSALITSGAGLAGLAGGLAAERRATREAGVAVADLARPPAAHYLLIALPFLGLITAAGDEHLIAAAGAAVLTQAAYVRRWRRDRAAR